jgi:hypothetical protein
MRSRTQSKRDQVQNGIKWDAEEPRDGGLMVEEHSVLRSLSSNVYWQLCRTNIQRSSRQESRTHRRDGGGSRVQVSSTTRTHLERR